MLYWIRRYTDGAALAVRAEADPREDFDVVPEYFHAGEGVWKADDELGSEMMHDPGFLSAGKVEVEKLIGPQAAA